MAAITEEQRTAIRSAPDPYQAAQEHNDRARLLAPEGECGGCFGAGTGTHCCICGGRR
jgi:hypothetical protein